MAEPRHTMFAARALGLADMFKVVFGKQRLEGTPAHTPELSAPDGPSTAGGKQALQHISLMPEGGGPTVVVGSANTVEKNAELRTYRYVAQMYQQRFKGATVPFAQPAYDDLTRKIQDFFSAQGFRVTLLDATVAAPPARAQVAPAAGGRNRLLPVVVLLAIIAAAAVAVALFR